MCRLFSFVLFFYSPSPNARIQALSVRWCSWFPRWRYTFKDSLCSLVVYCRLWSTQSITSSTSTKLWTRKSAISPRTARVVRRIWFGFTWETHWMNNCGGHTVGIGCILCSSRLRLSVIWCCHDVCVVARFLPRDVLLGTVYHVKKPTRFGRISLQSTICYKRYGQGGHSNAYDACCIIGIAEALAGNSGNHIDDVGNGFT